ncbi:MAG: hypothetical protein KF678_03400 [Phycisphaeraceae bacterium]|nr:hypothetical protein [Phycisphaeraceae bacterium]
MARRTLPGPLLCVLSGALLGGVPGACTNRPAPQPSTPRVDAPPTPSLVSPSSPLARAIESQRRRPARESLSAPVPAGIDADLGVVISTDDAKARLELADVLAQLAGPRVQRPTREANDDAVLRYIEGRTRMFAGDLAGAMEQLKSATELDPGAPEPWRELGEVQLLRGQRTEAMRSFRAAAAAGIEDARTLEHLGRNALERGDFSEAAVFLARATQMKPELADPALPSVLGVSLARALAAQGYIRAALESIRGVLTSPPQLTSTSRYAAELGAIFRRQGDLWRDAGDWCCQLGNYEEAGEAYRAGRGLPALESTPLRPRLIFALLRSGRPAEAAAEVIVAIAGEGGRISESDIDLLRYVARHGGNAAHMGEEIDSLARQAASPSLQRDLSWAKIRLLGQDQAGLLRRHVAAFPQDTEASVALLNAARDGAAALDEAARLAAANPAATKTLAEAVLRSRHWNDLPSSGEPSAKLLLAFVEAKRGRLNLALSAVSTLDSPASIARHAALGQVEIGLDIGDMDAAEAGLKRLRAGRDVDSQRLLARGLFLLSKLTDAETEVQSVLNTAPQPGAAPRVADLLLGADIALRQRRGDVAEARLNAAAELDPYDDCPWSLLMVLHSAEGPLPDNAKLSHAVRELRQKSPESRTVRVLLARDLMRRQQWTKAEAELRSLVDGDPGDAGPIELLAMVWQERLKAPGASVDEARDWLLAHLRIRPQAPVLLAALASLDASRGKPSEAEAIVREALSTGGGPDVSRVLERLLRNHLGREAEADELAAKRLDKSHRTPAESLEVADIAMRQRKPLDAMQALAAITPPDVAITSDQAMQAVAMAAKAIDDARGGQQAAEVNAAASRVIESCIGLVPRLTPELHERRIEAMAMDPARTKEDLLQAAILWLQQHPRTGPNAFLKVVQSLAAARRAALIPDFLEEAVNSGAADVPVLLLWFEAVAEFGDAAKGRALVDRLHAIGRLPAVMNQIAPNLDPAEIRDLRAEAAYILGVFFAQLNRDADSNAMYEHVLTIDPNHAWTCNNLGYYLADRGIELDRASELLERAYAAKPGETSIIDSLAWLRYKRGVIVDVTDPETGQVKVRGAVSLLLEAARTVQGQRNNTIQDHLGDALWLAGRREEAVAAWERAADLCRWRLDAADDARGAADIEPGESADVVRARAILESTNRKREAAAAGRRVQVAPQVADPDPQPRAENP